MFDVVEEFFDALGYTAEQIDYIFNHTMDIDKGFETNTNNFIVLQQKLTEISEQLSNISTWLYILAGLGALLLVLQIVILVKIMRKSNTTTNRKQLPAPKGEADGEIIE